MNKQNLDNLIDGKNSVDKVSENVDSDVLMKRMFKLMMESMMEAERTTFLGYGSGNSRNGSYERDLLTTMGNLDDLKISRDRLGEFSSELLDKYERATKPMDKMVLALYAKGMSTRDIGDIVNELYGRTLSPQAVTDVTETIVEQRGLWEKRPLAKRYVAIFIDALVVKIRRDVVDNDAVYVIAGIDEFGYRDVLGLYYGTSESAAYWEEKLNLFMTFLEFPKGIRKFMYTTNWIERLNKEFRKVLKNKNSMPTEDSVRNLLYLKVKDLSFKWHGQKLQGFSMYSAELNEIWEKRYPSQERGFTQNT